MNDLSSISADLFIAKYPHAWIEHYKKGLCRTCPKCNKQALTNIPLTDKEKLGVMCDYCGYKKIEIERSE